MFGRHASGPDDPLAAAQAYALSTDSLHLVSRSDRHARVVVLNRQREPAAIADLDNRGQGWLVAMVTHCTNHYGPDGHP